MKTIIPGRLSGLNQAKAILDGLMRQLYFFVWSTSEEYKYRRLEDIPLEGVAASEHIKNEFIVWNERFTKYLHRSTSKFSRQEQVVIDVLLINYRSNFISVSTCIQPETTILGQFDNECDELATLAASVLRARKDHTLEVFDLSPDIDIIHPLY
jgi:hypothetical protein